MNEQYVTLVGKVCASRYETVYTPEVKSLLPMEIKSEGRRLKDYAVYGNNNVGRNKFGFADATKTDGNTEFVADSESGTISANGLPEGSSYITCISLDTLPAGTYTFTGDAGAGSATHYMYVRKQGDSTTIANDYTTGMQEFTLTEATKLTVYCRLISTNTESLHIFRPMICVSGETPASFEPYQIGVGKKTKNLLSIADFEDVGKNNVVMTADQNKGTISVYTTGAPSSSTQGRVYFTVKETGNYLLSGIPSTAPNSYLDMYCYDSARNQRVRAWDKTSSSEAVTKNRTESQIYLVAGETYSVNLRAQTGYGKQPTPVIISPMVRKAEATANFEMYGYQAPIYIKKRSKNEVDITDVNQDKYGITVVEQDSRLHIFGTFNSTTAGVINFIPSYAQADGRDITLPAGDYVLSGGVANTNSNYRMQLGTMVDNSWGITIGYDVGEGLSFTLSETTVVRLRLNVKSAAYDIPVDLTFSPMIRIANTSDEYEPYWIPAGQEVVHLGSSPLTEGESVSRTVGNAEITLTKGWNVIDTDLYNKPELYIK